MSPADFDRVFGRGRLRMVTGDHVEVFREEALPGERRRYTKRFLATPAGDFRHWTEREWRILARLVGHGIGAVPEIVQFDRGATDRPALVQTYDAGVTVDHWATLLPVERDGAVRRHVFEDCAHWWALARHCLAALDAIHELHLVHLDLKADNVCIPVDPADFDPRRPDAVLRPAFAQITLIDFAFSLVSGESLASALPIARQLDYEYQSPRLLHALEEGSRGNLAPTRQLDWRCDFFSLAAMLLRYLPEPEAALPQSWTPDGFAEALALVHRLVEIHDAERPAQRPHAALIDIAARATDEPRLAASLQRGWTLAPGSAAAADASPTPVTRIALPVIADPAADPIAIDRSDIERMAQMRPAPHSDRRRRALLASALAAGAALSVPFLGEAWLALQRHRGEAPVVVATAPAEALPAPARPTSADTTAADTTAANQTSAPPAHPPTTAPREFTEPMVVAAAPETAASSAAAAMHDAPRERVQRPAAGTEGAERAPSKAGAPQAHATRSAGAVARKPAVTAAARSLGATSSRGGVSATGKKPAAIAASKATGRTRLAAAASARYPLQRMAKATAPTSRGSTAKSKSPSPAWLAAPTWAEAPASATASAAPPRVALAVPEPVQSPAPTASTPPAAGTAPMPFPRQSEADDTRLASTAQEPPDYAVRARELMATHIPRIAQRAERLVMRVLFVAAQADDAAGDEAIRSAASAVRLAPRDPLTALAVSAHEARRLNEAGRNAFWSRGSVEEAVAYQSRAFGADPTDPEIVGNLAFLRLKQRPAQPEAARELALHALAVHDARHPTGRIEDWTTLAIASALAGRDRDARDAWLVSLALAPNVARQCRAALNAYAIYGERLRGPVEAMLHRAQTSGRGDRSAFCEWPPHWVADGGLR